LKDLNIDRYNFSDDKRDNEKEIHQWEQWDIDDDGFLLPKNYDHDFPRRQKQAGKSFGLSFVLNPALDEYFCTSSDSKGFRVIDILTQIQIAQSMKFLEATQIFYFCTPCRCRLTFTFPWNRIE